MRFSCFFAERLELMCGHVLPARRNWSETSLLVAVVEDKPALLEAFAYRSSDFAHVPSVGYGPPLTSEVDDTVRRRAPVGESALRQLRLNGRNVPRSAGGIRENPLCHCSPPLLA